MPVRKSSQKFQKELNAGAISLVLLKVLEQHQEPMYGYEIARLLESRSGGDLPMNQAAIYPVLRSLEKQGLLKSRMVPSDAGPPRKYYQLTAAGKRTVADLQAVWHDTTSFVNSFLEHTDDRDASSTRGELPRAARKTAQAKGGRRP